MAPSVTYRNMWIRLAYMLMIARMSFSPVKPALTKRSALIYTLESASNYQVPDFAALFTSAMLSFDDMTEFKQEGHGEHAELKILAQAALSSHKSELCCVNQLLELYRKHAKSATHRHRAHKRQGNKHVTNMKKLKQRLAKQALQVRRQKAQQAQHARRLARVEGCICTVGVDCYNQLTQLTTDVKHAQAQHLELSSQVRANSRAQDLLARLAGVVEELRTELQVSVGTHQTVKKVVTEVTHLKQDITSIKGARQQLQQQTGMLAELRYELKTSVDSRQDLQTRTASLEGAHALMTQSLRTQHLSTGPKSLRAPKRTSSRLSVVQEVLRETSEDGTAPLPLETAHNLHGPTPTSTHAQHQSQGMVLLPNSPVAAIAGTDTSRGAVPHGFTPGPVRQPRLSDFQDMQAAKYRSRSLQAQMALSPLIPAGRQLTKLTTLRSPTGLSLSSPFEDKAGKAENIGCVPLPLKLAEDPPQRHCADDAQDKYITPAPLPGVLPRRRSAEDVQDKDNIRPDPLLLQPTKDSPRLGSAEHAQDKGHTANPLLQSSMTKPVSPKASPFEIAAQKATNQAKHPASTVHKASSEAAPSSPSGTRVMDQIAELRRAHSKQDGAPFQQPSLRAAAMRGNFNQQQWNAGALDLLGPAVDQQHLSDANSGYHESQVKLPLYQAPDGRAPSAPTRAPPPPSRAPPPPSRAPLSSSTTLMPASNVRKVSASPFASYKGNGPQLPDSPLRVQSLPILSERTPPRPPPPSPASPPIPDPSQTPPLLKTKPSQPSPAMPASPTLEHNHTADSLTPHLIAQDSVEPKASLLKQMGRHSSKPVRELVKVLKKDR